MAMAELSSPQDPKRIIVLLRDPETAAKKSGLRRNLVWVAAPVVLAIGLALGYRAASLFTPEPVVSAQTGQLTERVKGGLYALELATPDGHSRWMLEFDAEIVTKDGPQNPLQLRDALEDLVITSTSLPLVQTSLEPEEQMRKSMLAIAAQSYPWLVDVYMTRSDIRSDTDKLGGIGRAMRDLYGQ